MADATTTTTPVSDTHRHFFRPLLPDFLVRFLIPPAFRKYFNGSIPGTVMLRSSYGGHRNWRVEVDSEWHFKDGWGKFCKDHDLRVGDFLVFKHEGNMSFDVVVLDPCACERDSPLLGRKVTNDSHPGLEAVAADPFAKAEASSASSQNSRFQLKLGAALLKHGILFVPKEFAMVNGLHYKKCEIILIDQKERHWSAKLNYKNADGRAFIKGNLRNFRIANSLKMGDVVQFELLDLGKTLALKCIQLTT